MKYSIYMLYPILACLFGLVIISFSFSSDLQVNAYSDEENIQDQLDDTVTEQLGQIDLSGLQEYLDRLDYAGQTVFGSTNIWDKINQLLSGDYQEGIGTFLSTIISVLFGDFLELLPILCTILAIGIICNLLSSFSLNNGDNSIGRIIEFVCFGLVIVIITSLLYGLLDSVGGVINNIKGQMDILFPIILTMIASVGGAVSVGIFQPMTALLSNLVIQLFSFIIIPLFVFCFVFVIVGNLSPNIKLDKFQKLFNTIFKWIIGIIFSIFSSLFILQGIVAGSFDSMTVRAAKFAIKSYVPILGGYLSDGFNLVAASSVLIKNAVGFTGLLLLFGTIISPLLDIIIFSLGLRLISAILEPIGAQRISNFLHQIAKLTNYLITILLAVGFMYILAIGVLMCTANIL